MWSYPTKYSDECGTENTIIHNDGLTLSLILRGVEFSGNDFDSLTPSQQTTKSQLTFFTLSQGALCACTIQCQIPIPVMLRELKSEGILDAEITLGRPSSNGGIDQEKLNLILHYGNERICSRGSNGWFEDELLDIQNQLPDGVYLKSCINCLYSDYSPAGHGLFGGMMCFRNLKTEYLKVKSKVDFWQVHGRQDRFVQETYVSDEFERRVSGTGYRG